MIKSKDKNKDLTRNKKNKSDKINDKLSEIQDRVQQLEKDLSLAREEKLRLLADMENLRKRSDKEKLESIKYGSANLARDILTPCDNLVRALESITEEEKNNTKNNNLINGINLVHQEIVSLLERHGIKKIEAINKKFDHNIHQAMLEIESDDVESGIVVKELQTGYMMHDRLLRASMVGVSKKKASNGEDGNK